MAADPASALTTAVRPLEVTNPVLAFVERRGGERTGVSLPPEAAAPVSGPTSGQWGSG